MITLNRSRVLVTGAAGFIGSNLVRAFLRAGSEVHCIVREHSDLWRLKAITSHINLHFGDITDLQAIEQIVLTISPHFIFHLAASPGHPHDWRLREQLLAGATVGTSNLLRAVDQINFVRFVHFCSSTVYGPREMPLVETDQLQPTTFRGAAKACSAIICQQYAREKNKPLVLIRPFSVYGDWESAKRLIPTTIIAALQDKEMALTRPDFRRDFIYVSDVVQACLSTLEAKISPGEVINVGSGVQWSNEQVVEMVQAIIGKMIIVRPNAYPASPADTSCWVADIEKAKQLLNWQSTHSLRTGLEKSVDWFRENLSLYQDSAELGI